MTTARIWADNMQPISLKGLAKSPEVGFRAQVFLASVVSKDVLEDPMEHDLRKVNWDRKKIEGIKFIFYIFNNDMLVIFILYMFIC